MNTHIKGSRNHDFLFGKTTKVTLNTHKAPACGNCNLCDMICPINRI